MVVVRVIHVFHEIYMNFVHIKNKEKEDDDRQDQVRTNYTSNHAHFLKDKNDDSDDSPENAGISTNLLNELQRFKQEAEFWRRQYVSEHQRVLELQMVNQLTKTPLNLTHLQSLPHLNYIRYFDDKIKTMLPFMIILDGVVPECTHWEESVGVTLETYTPGRVQFLCRSIEYILFCALGNRKEISLIFP